MRQTFKSFKVFIQSFIMLASVPLVLVSCGQTTNAEPGLAVQMGINDEDGIVLGSRVPQTFVAVTNSTDSDTSIIIQWRIETDDWRPLMQMRVSLQVSSQSSRLAYCPWFEFPGPGFYRITASIGSGSEVLISDLVMGIDPELIPVTVDATEDFDDFWQRSLNELSGIAPDYELIKQRREKTAKTDLYAVEMTSFNGLRIRGWLEVPKKRGKYPALLRVPGYKSVRKPIDKYDDLVVLSMNPRGHGESDDTKMDRDLDMWVRGLEHQDSYFYRGAYLDCIRMVDFLEGREEVDQDRIAIWGGSQGGGFAFATAALDQRIDLCISDIPWMSEWADFFAMTHWPKISAWFGEHPEQNWESMLKTLSYFDTKNMAQRISCPVIMSVGLQDAVCPPSTSFRTYNLINSQKSYTVYRDAGHWYPDGHKEDRFHRIRTEFEMD